MDIRRANLMLMVFTPCFALIAGILIGMMAADQKYIDENEYYCHPIPEIMAEAKICKPR